MIWLTRLNGQRFVLNCDLIKQIEATPDTVITLVQGEKLMVREDVQTVVSITMDYRKRLYQEPPLFRDQLGAMP
jgi:flagellar protein FlbD